MAKMVPPYCLTESRAERKMFERFRSEAGTEEWIVLHSQGLTRRGNAPYGEIDFVIVIQGAGVFCIEVKGGGISRKDGVWYTTGQTGTHQLKQSPFIQARRAMFALRDAVSRR